MLEDFLKVFWLLHSMENWQELVGWLVNLWGDGRGQKFAKMRQSINCDVLQILSNNKCGTAALESSIQDLLFFPFLSSIEKKWHWDYTSRISEDSSRDSYHVNWKTKEKSRILFSKEIWLSGGHFLGKNGAFFSGFENEWILNLEVTEFRPTYRVFKQVLDRLQRKGDPTWIFSQKCPKSNSKLSLTPCMYMFFF